MQRIHRSLPFLVITWSMFFFLCLSSAYACSHRIQTLITLRSRLTEFYSINIPDNMYSNWLLTDNGGNDDDC